MKLIPAIDLKDNKCVRLVKGKEQSSKIYNENPIDQAKFFEDQDCERIHVVDLDAAFGRPKINEETIVKIRKSIKTPIQLGGGLRSIEDIKFWLDNNIDYLVIGSLSVKNSNLVKEIAEEFENRIYISIDVLNEQVMIKGWVEETKLEPVNIMRIYDKSKIRGYIITDISRDGTMRGLDSNFINSIIETRMPLNLNNYKSLIFSGGITDYSDLQFLKNISLKIYNNDNIEGIIVGKAIYTGEIAIIKGNKILNSNA